VFGHAVNIFFENVCFLGAWFLQKFYKNLPLVNFFEEKYILFTPFFITFLIKSPKYT